MKSGVKSIDGTSARQLDLLDDREVRPARPMPAGLVRPRSIRLLRRDVYAELTRRRRRAQIQARHLIED